MAFPNSHSENEPDDGASGTPITEVLATGGGHPRYIVLKVLLAVATVALPIFTVCFEFCTRMCSSAYINPIPGPLHVCLILLVPYAGMLTCQHQFSKRNLTFNRESPSFRKLFMIVRNLLALHCAALFLVSCSNEQPKKVEDTTSSNGKRKFMALASLPQASIGEWEGKALQSKEVYPMTVDISREHVLVNYSSVPCDGEWYLSKVEHNKLTFRELIKHGIAECCQDGIIVLELLPGDEIKYEFFDNSKERGVYAVATLKRSKNE